MKRTRAQQPKAPEPQDPAVAEAGNPKPQRRAKQPKGAAKKPAASPVPDTALTVCFTEGEEEAGPQPVDWDIGTGVGAWWTWGVDEDKLLGWFPFVEEDFRCLAGRAGDAGPAFDDDIWRIHQIYEIPSYAAK
jgi:hypothetical protein